MVCSVGVNKVYLLDDIRSKAVAPAWRPRKAEQLSVEDRVAGPSITVTGLSQRQAWRDRVLPPVEKVRPGVWSVPTPFPDSPLRYVLAYLVETPRGPALVDTGWPSDDAWDGLVAGVRETGHEVSDIVAVLVTHFHADHFGLADRVREASGAWIGMHEADARAVGRYSTVGDFAVADRAWLARRGVSAGEIEGMLPSAHVHSRRRAHPDVMIEDGARPLGDGTPLRAIWTPGHTPGHLCFADERYNVLLTGDHVLPRISPNISPSPGNTDDILGTFLRSLTELAGSEPDEVLPAHEYRFSGLAARVHQLRDHHRARLREVLAVVAGAAGCSTADVAERLTWSRPWDQARGMVRRSAIGETYAHLVYLERRGLIANGTGDADHWRLPGPASAAADLIPG
jgi:glyoxylase-like metal-dependent hydrolase (beta-lactamase superfamily II)